MSDIRSLVDTLIREQSFKNILSYVIITTSGIYLIAHADPYIALFILPFFIIGSGRQRPLNVVLARSAVPARIQIPLAIIPLGTANVVAREIGQSFQPHKIAQTLAFGQARPVTVGLANNHRFLMMAGTGFDANVVAGVSLVIKKHTGPLAYVLEAIRQALFGNPSMCEVSIDGKCHQATSVIVCNGSRYGGPFVAAPDASFASNEFQIILFRGHGFFSLLRYGMALIFNRLNLWSDVDILGGREIHISGVKNQPIQTDGEIMTVLPVHLSLESGLLSVIYPPEASP